MPERTRQQTYGALPPRLDPGDTLETFAISGEIARGATAAVYGARDLETDGEVALKVLSPHLGLIEEAIRRFEKESALAARVRDPCVIEIHGHGRDRGHHYYAMALESGQTMEGISLVGEAPGGDGAHQRVCALFAGVARALHRLHCRGVVHRDVKPQNLLLGKGGRLVLCDFGSAIESGERTTPEQPLWGTPRYLSPDQFTPDGDPGDPRLDVYALGLTLYEVVTGTQAFSEVPTEELARAKLSQRIPAPREADRTLPMRLDSLIRHAIEPDPARRHPSAAALAADLEAFATGLPR